MLDLVAIAQSAPGAIAVNGAIVVGYKLAGIIGTIVAIIATILPPFIVITIISFFYEVFRDNQIVSLVLEGMQVGVAEVIASVVWKWQQEFCSRKNGSLGRLCLVPHCGSLSEHQCRGDHPCMYCHRPDPHFCRNRKEAQQITYLQLFLSFIQISASSVLAAMLLYL